MVSHRLYPWLLYFIFALENPERLNSGLSLYKFLINSIRYAKATDLEVNTYQVREITAPKGYALDPRTYTVTVKEDKTVTVTSTDMPQNDHVSISLEKY